MTQAPVPGTIYCGDALNELWTMADGAELDAAVAEAKRCGEWPGKDSNGIHS